MEKSLQGLKVSANKRYLVHEDGTAFFWLGDTVWELFHNLNREEALIFLKNRAELKYTVIQAVGLAEFGGLVIENAYGHLPLKTNDQGSIDPTLPALDAEYNYWEHVDYIVNTAAELGMYIAFLPTWGDKYHKAWGEGPEIFTEANARIFGEWLGKRYKNQKNIIWVLGGDRPLVRKEHFDVVNAMAAGLAEGDEGNHLISFHPAGDSSSARHMHDAPWLDFNMIQSGHGQADIKNYGLVTEDYERTPIKPTVDSEPCYEDHPIGFKAVNGYFDEADVRKAAYYAVFSGAFGHTYGHHSIWSMTTKPTDYFIMTWKDALMRPGAKQMQHVRALIESKTFLDRVPDQSMIVDNYPGSNYMTATRGESFALIYSPNGLKATVNMKQIKGDRVKASWFDPRTGQTLVIGEMANSEEQTFNPPSAGRGNDWVLVLDGM